MLNNNIYLAGILNITEDSFSDGGEYLSIEKAKNQLINLSQYSDVIDIGAISSNPMGKDVSIEEEIKRLKPIIEFAIENNIPISIDTWRYETQKFCLNYQIKYLNDINGFPNSDLYPLLRDHEVKLIVMHQISSGRAQMDQEVDHNQIFYSIINFFDDRLNALIQAGISKERILIDPGMGFFLGNNYLNSFCVINMIPELKKRYGLPVYVSVSRKSFLGKVANIENPKERNYVTLACEIALILKGVDWIRTHNPKAIKDSLKLLNYIQL
ncbi:MAG: dihydropteroate synthase [Leptospiraceae bacterium]|nr:MAG: dihydropteroate synthase [Leptospiraceae bacterium]